MNPEGSIVIPMVDALGPTIQAAQQFQMLDVTGVLFLVIVVLGGILIYKSKNNSKMTELSNSIGEIVAVSKQTVDMLQALNVSNNQLILQKLDTMKDTLDKIETNLRELEHHSWTGHVMKNISGS